MTKNNQIDGGHSGGSGDARLRSFLSLDDEALAEALELRFGEDESSEVASVEAFSEVCRAALAPELNARVAGLGEGRLDGASRGSDALRERRIAERVLARTTREDLRRRADFGLVIDFVGERLRQSAWLRVAAALLLAQLTIVPLVAAFHFARQPERPDLQVRIEPAPEVYEALPERDEDAVVDGGSETVEDLEELPPMEAELRAALPADLPPGARTDEGRALAALESVLRGAQTLAPRRSSSPLALWADLEARVILWRDAGRSEGLAVAIDDVTAALEGASDRDRALLSAALETARSSQLHVAEIPSVELGWREALAASLDELDDPVARRWREALSR